jgi:predicted NBD/HSP70 family sugar kinase
MLPITNNTVRVKQINVELVKTALKALTYGTKLTIANATGLSVATCGNILNELLDRGEVIEAEFEQSSGGRPAKRFLYNANYAYIACIYVSTDGGIYKYAYAVTNLLGEIIEKYMAEVASINYELIDELIGKLIGKYDNIKAVGIGVPGIVHKGVIDPCDIEMLSQIPLAAMLKAKYNLEIIIENDMNLITYGYYKQQNYEEDKTIAVVAFPKDNCPGAGIIVNGHIIKGNTNFAGEVSYLPFDISREDQVKQTNSSNAFFSTMVKIVTSIIAIINPHTIVLTGGLIHSNVAMPLIGACSKITPPEHMPQLIIRKNMQSDYMYGLLSVSLESLNCNIQLVEKRI